MNQNPHQISPYSKHFLKISLFLTGTIFFFSFLFLIKEGVNLGAVYRLRTMASSTFETGMGTLVSSVMGSYMIELWVRDQRRT